MTTHPINQESPLASLKTTLLIQKDAIGKKLTSTKGDEYKENLGRLNSIKEHLSLIDILQNPTVDINKTQIILTNHLDTTTDTISKLNPIIETLPTILSSLSELQTLLTTLEQTKEILSILIAGHIENSNNQQSQPNQTNEKVSKFMTSYKP